MKRASHKPIGSTNVPSKNKDVGTFVIGYHLSRWFSPYYFPTTSGDWAMSFRKHVNAVVHSTGIRRSPLRGSVLFAPKVNPSNSCSRYSKVPKSMKKQDKTFPYDVSSLERMISDIQARNRGSVGRIAESSFFRIPAVKSFKIEASEPNELLRGTGLDRKLPSKKTIELQEGNNKLNIYIENKILKLREYLRVGRPDLFWKLVDHEMKRSIAFRVAAFNRVHKG